MGLMEDVLRKSKIFVSGIQCDCKLPPDECTIVGSRILGLVLSHTDRDAPSVKNRLSMIAQFLEAVSRVPEIISCGGVGVDVMKTLDSCPSTKVSIHYPFDVKSLNLHKLLQKPSYSVMGRIDLLAFQSHFYFAGLTL